MANLTFYTIYSQTYPESDNNPSGASGTRDGITPGFNNVTSSELLDFSRDMNYAVWDNATNSWVADSYFNGTRLSGHCYDTYSSTTRAQEHAQFQSDYGAIVTAFPDATHIVCGSHAADHNDLDSDTLAILKGLGGPSSWPTGRPEYILIGKPGLGAGNAYVWQYENDTTGRAHANVGLPILGGKKSGGNYLEFDGSSDNISVADNSALDITGDMTMSCWVALDSSENGNLCMIANKRDGSDYTAPYYMFFEDRSGQNKYGAFLGGGSPNYIAVGSNDNFDGVYGKWDHVCFTVSGTTVSMYVNGAFDASGTFTGSRQTNDVPLKIAGPYTDGGSNYMMAGKIASLLIYNKALSAAEVKSNFNSQRRRFGV